MPKLESFGETASVTVTILVDNRTDLLAKSDSAEIRYFDDQPLIAEHGFATLVELEPAGIRILWDSGATQTAVLENMRRLKIAPTTLSAIALSHGHDDHTSGLTQVLKAMQILPAPREWSSTATLTEMQHYAEGRRVPVIVHPAAFRERWQTRTDGTKYGPIAPPPRGEWEANGAGLVLSEGPYQLGPGCWTTGAIPRQSFETAGTTAAIAYRQGETLVRDYVDDDQAILVHVKGKGLVVLSGCAHAGIVNTLNHAREISGVQEVWAVMGGFHLAKAGDEEIRRTLDGLVAYQPRWVVPSHCTGFKALNQFASRMPREFAQGLVGATFLF